MYNFLELSSNYVTISDQLETINILLNKISGIKHEKYNTILPLKEQVLDCR
jgi:hypothetical protein